MKKSLFTTAFLLSILSYGQVGINTPNPQSSFHIDGAKDNVVTGVPTITQQANDVVVTSSGSMGLGTVSPATRLDINNGTTAGAIKIVDGTQGDGKVLTSDASGIATWKLTTNDVQGSEIKKKKYEGPQADDTNTVQIGPVEFRIRGNGVGGGYPEMHFTSAVTENTLVTYHTGQYYSTINPNSVNGYAYSNQNRTFTPSNWTTWQNVSNSPTDGMNNLERNQIWLSIQGTTDIYCVDFIILRSGRVVNGEAQNIYSIIATKY